MEINVKYKENAKIPLISFEIFWFEIYVEVGFSILQYNLCQYSCDYKRFIFLNKNSSEQNETIKNLNFEKYNEIKKKRKYRDGPMRAF